MTLELATTIAPTQDRRVRRSRAALMRAAVTLVSERGTAAVAISDLAEAADVSRQLVYLQFGDRDTLLLEAALDLARRELLPCIQDAPEGLSGRARPLTLARHFAEHRAFYRAMLTSSCAFGLNKALAGLFIAVNRRVAQQMCGEQLDADTVEDLATFLTGGASAFVNSWVIEGDDPLDPEEFTDRLLRMVSVVVAERRPPTAVTQDKEPRP